MIFPHAKRASVRRDAGKLDFVQNAAADQVDADQLGFSLSHACVEIGMRAAPLNHGRTAGPQAEDRDAGMDIQNVKIAASSGCPEIQVVALALHVGVQIPAPAERPDILSVLLADVPPFSFVTDLLFIQNERVLHKMFGRGLTPLVFRLQIVRSRNF